MDNMTLEEALAAADVSTTPVNDILMVDAEARTIIVPASEMLFGVRQDMDTERKHFKCQKIVGDNVDLSNCHIYISYVPSKQDGTYDINEDVGAYLCEDLDVDGDYVTFSWKLSGNVFAKAGYIAFAVYAKQADADGNLQTKWHTTFAIGKVLDTLPDGEQIVEKYADVIEQLLNRMDEVEAIVTPEAMQNYVEAYLAENPPSGMTADEKAQLQKNTEDISSLSEEMANLDVRSIADIQKTASELLVDTYTITYTDGTSSTFQVTNGSSDEAYIADGSITIEKLSTDVMEVIEKASKSVEYKWIPRGLMREQIKTFQGWAHCVRYDERLRKAVGIVMAGEAAHTNELPLYRVIIDDNGNMSDYEEITLLDTDGVTEYVPSNGYICGFCILSDGTYLIQDNTWVGSYPSFYKSTDYGKTFTKIESTGNPTQAFGLRQLSTGRVISGCTGGLNRFYYSDDLGTTWNESNVLDVTLLGKPPFEGDSKYEFSEHCIIEFTNGTLLAIGRSSNNARDSAGVVRGHLEGAIIAYSDDYGETWRDFGWSKTITHMTSNNASCVCVDGIYHLVMGDRYTYTTDEEGNRRYFAMYYQYATEEDALNDNWSEPVVIDYGHWTSNATTPTDCGYPSLWKDAVNNLHCVFYDGDGSGTAYGANWRLIDGNPYVQSKPVSDNGSGSLAIAYSQKQVEFMLEEQRKSIMNVMMVYINDLYDKAGSLVPDSGENDGTNYITSDLLLYFDFVDKSLWDETNKYLTAKYSATGDMYCHMANLTEFEISTDYPTVWNYGLISWNSTKETSTAPYPNIGTNKNLAELGVNSEVGFSLEFGGFALNKSNPTKIHNATFDYSLTRTGGGLSWPTLDIVPTIVDGAITGVSCGSVSISNGDLLHAIYVFTPNEITVYKNGVKIGNVTIDGEQYNTLKTTYVKNCGSNNASRTINRLYNAPLTADQCMNNYKWFKNFVETYEYPTT